MDTDFKAREKACDAVVGESFSGLQLDLHDALARVAREAWDRGREFGMQRQAELDNAIGAATLDLRHAADMRAIARWQTEKPGRQLRQPSHEDLCVWLLGRLEEAEEALEQAQEQLTGVYREL